MTGTLTQTNDQWVELIRNYHRVTVKKEDAYILLEVLERRGVKVRALEKQGKVTIEKV